MIDIEQVKYKAIQMYAHLNDVKFANNLSSVLTALHKLERLQKRDEDVRLKLIKRIDLNKKILQDEPDVEIEAENTALEMVMMLMNWSDEK